MSFFGSRFNPRFVPRFVPRFNPQFHPDHPFGHKYHSPWQKQQITTKKKSENITYFAGIQVVFRTLVFSRVSDFRFRNTLSDLLYTAVSKMRKSENRNIDIFETVSKQKAFKRRLTRWHRRGRPNDTPSRTPHTESYPMIYLTYPHYGGTD